MNNGHVSTQPTPSGPVLPSHTLLDGLHCPPGVGSACRLIETAMSDLSAAHLPAALDKAVLKRQQEYLAGRVCAAEALRAAGCRYPVSPEMGVDRLPIWPESWVGSISHSGDYAVALAATQQRYLSLGVDIQQQVSGEVADNLRTLLGSPEEYALLEHLPPQAAVSLMFSAKESLYKALFPLTRRIQEFDSARLVAAVGASLTFELAHDWSAQWRRHHSLAVCHAFCGEYVVTATYLERT